MNEQNEGKAPGEGAGKREAAAADGAAGAEKSAAQAPKKSLEEIVPRFLVSSSPHVHEGQTIAHLMRLVIYALMPATLFSIIIFGLPALKVILVSIASAVVFEALTQRLMKRPVRVNDWSAALTGLLLALNLPASSPWWMVVIGNLFAIVIAKQIYGGIGYNLFNPALIGRVVLLLAFPVQMTAAWIKPSIWGMDAVSTATPLGRIRESIISNGRIDYQFTSHDAFNFLLGNRAGSLGEVSVVLLLVGGIFLLWKRVISWHTPVAYIGSLWIMTAIFHAANPSRFADPSFHVITGGLWLGALYMATDYVTGPVTAKGMLIFGVGCGVLTAVIRLFGSFPEGVAFAILLMNAFAPLIDRYTTPTVFGARKKVRAKAVAS